MTGRPDVRIRRRWWWITPPVVVVALALALLLPPFVHDNSDAANLQARLLTTLDRVAAGDGFSVLRGTANSQVGGNAQGSDDCWVYASVEVATSQSRSTLAARLRQDAQDPAAAVGVFAVEPVRGSSGRYRVATGEPDGGRLDFRCAGVSPYQGL